MTQEQTKNQTAARKRRTEHTQSQQVTTNYSYSFAYTETLKCLKNTMKNTAMAYTVQNVTTMSESV